jgi:Spy/CpxP family protein refolding chaperone
MIDMQITGQTNERQMFNRGAFGEKRNAFLTTEAGLTKEEAGKFLPLENEFKQKLFEVGMDCRRLARESQNRQKMSDAEYKKLIDCYQETRQKEAQLEKEYYEKFNKLLTPEKIYKYQQADTKFSREIVVERRPAENRNSDTNRDSTRNNNSNRSRR